MNTNIVNASNYSEAEMRKQLLVTLLFALYCISNCTTNIHRLAYAVYVDGSDYLNSTAMLAQRIRKFATKYPEADLIALHTITSDVSVLREAGWNLIPVDIIHPFKKVEFHRYKNMYTKLWLWSLDNLYDAILYMDCDVLVLGQIDHLFDIMLTRNSEGKPAVELAAVTDAWPDSFDTYFNAGVMLLRPSYSVFTSMITNGPYISYDGRMSEQAFLNTWFRFSNMRLPAIYNLNAVMYASNYHHTTWTNAIKDCRILHYTVCKPMLEASNCDQGLSSFWDNAINN